MPEPDLSEFVALSKSSRLKCGVALVLRNLNAKDRRSLRAALDADHDTIGHAAIAAWLAARGVKTAAGTVARHRRKECSCDA